jgi:hypothetical protein
MATPPRQGRTATATATLRIAVAGFAYRGVTMQRALSDTGSCYRSPPRYGIGATMGSRPPSHLPDGGAEWWPAHVGNPWLPVAEHYDISPVWGMRAMLGEARRIALEECR